MFRFQFLAALFLCGLASQCLPNSLHAQVPDYVPTNGLVAWYPFNGNANDESGNNHHGTIDGPLFDLDREGSASSSATFDGIDDGIFIPHHTDFESAEKTISFWMSPATEELLDTPSLADGMGVINKTNHTGSNLTNRYYDVSLGQGTTVTAPFSLILATSTGNIVTNGYSVESTTAQDAINANEWQHVSAVQTSTELKLYLNGIQISSSPLLNPPLENDYDIKIGVDYKFNEYRYFNGAIDDITFHNRALTEGEILALSSTEPLADLTLLLATDSSTYYFNPTPLPWTDASAYANSINGHLLTLTTIEENEAVFSSFDSVADPMNGCHIGLYQNTSSADSSEPSGGWEWVTSESVLWTNWKSGEPNNGGNFGSENVTSFHGSGEGAWNDIHMSIAFPSILEIPIEPIDIMGCTDSTACNFDPEATHIDGSCDFSCYPTTPDLPDFLPAADLLVWIPVEGEASNIIDNEYSAFMSNGAGLGPDRFGNPNSAVDLPGMIQIPNSGDLWTDDFTFAFWTRKDANLGHNVIQVGEIGGGLQYSAGWTSLNGGLNSNGSPRLYLGPMDCSGGYSPGGIMTECTATSGEWMHVAFVYLSDTLTIYKNGEPCDYSNVSDGSLSFNCFSDDFGTYIGGDIGGGIIEYYDGAFDDLAIYSRGLSDLEILSIFNETTAVAGCTDSTACNFDPEATFTDGSCIPSGCTEEEACNFNADAGCDDGSCDYSCCPGPGCCGDGTTWDSNSSTCIVTNATDADLDGCTGVSDILEVLLNFGQCTSTNDTLAETPWACGDPVNYWYYDYATVLIGDQCWFAENLRTERFNNGDSILYITENDEWAAMTTPGMCWYQHDPAGQAQLTGGLYNWYSVNDTRQLCPSGWHVSTDEDWMALELSSGMDSSEIATTGFRGTASQSGVVLKASSNWCCSSNGTDSLGFNGQAGGWRNGAGGFGAATSNGIWWTSDDLGWWPMRRDLAASNDGVQRCQCSGSHDGFSVRCIKE